MDHGLVLMVDPGSWALQFADLCPTVDIDLLWIRIILHYLLQDSSSHYLTNVKVFKFSTS